MSIFNSLLTVGIIGRMLAETHIVEDMNNILLKEYYKKTGLLLVNRHKERNTVVPDKPSPENPIGNAMLSRLTSLETKVVATEKENI